jgi:hypothetical protein
MERGHFRRAIGSILSRLKMLTRGDRESADVGPVFGTDEIDSREGEGSSPLSSDENERLIALLWHDDPAPSRKPEPFGMIA